MAGSSVCKLRGDLLTEFNWTQKQTGTSGAIKISQSPVYSMATTLWTATPGSLCNAELLPLHIERQKGVFCNSQQSHAALRLGETSPRWTLTKYYSVRYQLSYQKLESKMLEMWGSCWNRALIDTTEKWTKINVYYKSATLISKIGVSWHLISSRMVQAATSRTCQKQQSLKWPFQAEPIHRPQC